MINKEFRIQIDPDHMRNLLANIVEKYMKNYIIDQHKPLINEIYPDTKDDPISIRILNPIPILESGGVKGLKTKPYIGQIRKRSVKRYDIYGWHGDLAIIVNSDKEGKRAIIFEIKFGSIQISRAQHKFFIAISEDTDKFLDKLNDIKIYIVNCYSLEFNENRMDVKIHEYHFPDERREYNERSKSEV